MKTTPAQDIHSVVTGWIHALQREEGAHDPSAASAWLRFLAYHEKRPDVWATFVNFTFEVINSGQKQYGVKAIFERIRWHYTIEKKGEFKLDNTAFHFYARVFTRAYPQHKTFFRTRGKSLTGLSRRD